MDWILTINRICIHIMRVFDVIMRWFPVGADRAKRVQSNATINNTQKHNITVYVCENNINYVQSIIRQCP